MGAHGLRWMAGLAGMALLLVACAPPAETPNELKRARDAYAEASRGPAATQAPGMLQEAQIALDEAERAFTELGGTPEVRDKAYIAQRKAETATMVAMTMHYEKRAQDAKTQQALFVDRMSRDLQAAHDELTSHQKFLVQAEARANAAVESLSQRARVAQEDRGLVIRIAAGDLFAPGTVEVLPEGAETLDKVVELMREIPERPARVEGFTDSRGPSERNRLLSGAQAVAVRQYLANHGIAAGRIEVAGRGEVQPVASNRTVTGREENRRVEIVILPVPVEE